MSHSLLTEVDHKIILDAPLDHIRNCYILEHVRHMKASTFLDILKEIPDQKHLWNTLADGKSLIYCTNKTLLFHYTCLYCTSVLDYNTCIVSYRTRLDLLLLGIDYLHTYHNTVYVTRFYKTNPNRTSGKIKLTPPVDSYTIILLEAGFNRHHVESSNGGFWPCEGPGLAKINGLLVDSLIMLAKHSSLILLHISP